MNYNFRILIGVVILLALVGVRPLLVGDARIADTPKPQNIILMVGDGMGPSQLDFAAAYSKKFRKTALNMEKLMRTQTMGLVTTHTGHTINTDSAASMTQLVTGHLSVRGSVGMDLHGNRQTTLLERFRAQGKATGFVTDTHILHATPAALYGHTNNRYNTSHLISSFLQSAPDLVLSAGTAWLIPHARHQVGEQKQWLDAHLPKGFSRQSKRSDERNLLKTFHDKGYALAFDQAGFQGLEALPAMGLFFPMEYPDSLQQKKKKVGAYPSLADLTQKALQLLAQNEKGFFAMIEAGQIDWAAHDNDAGRMLHDLLHFDEAVGVALEFVKNRKDTLLVVTADHETGGFHFSQRAFDIPNPVGSYVPTGNYNDFEQLQKIAQQNQTFFDVFLNFEKLPQSQQTPHALASRINAISAFKLTEVEAQEILKKTDFTMHYRDGREKTLRIPYIQDFTHFYAASDLSRSALVARALAKQTGVVWATGRHTNNPVPLMATGPGATLLGGLKSQDEVGKILARYATP